MGFESIGKSKAQPEEKGGQDQEVAKKWIETVDTEGKKVSIGVFGDETDAEAMARAKEIDDRLDREGKSERTLS